MRIPRRKSDELIKGVSEDNLSDFITFLYPNASGLFDLEREIILRGKELHATVPDRERKKRCPGSHPDIQERVYEYNDHIRDRFCLPVAPIVIYTGDKKTSERLPNIRKTYWIPS